MSGCWPSETHFSFFLQGEDYDGMDDDFKARDFSNLGCRERKHAVLKSYCSHIQQGKRKKLKKGYGFVPMLRDDIGPRMPMLAPHVRSRALLWLQSSIRLCFPLAPASVNLTQLYPRPVCSSPLALRPAPSGCAPRSRPRRRPVPPQQECLACRAKFLLAAYRRAVFKACAQKQL